LLLMFSRPYGTGSLEGCLPASKLAGYYQGVPAGRWASLWLGFPAI